LAYIDNGAVLQASAKRSTGNDITAIVRIEMASFGRAAWPTSVESGQNCFSPTGLHRVRFTFRLFIADMARALTFASLTPDTFASFGVYSLRAANFRSGNLARQQIDREADIVVGDSRTQCRFRISNASAST
jgi:hypothetical protein